jgi:hypothetical protein
LLLDCDFLEALMRIAGVVSGRAKKCVIEAGQCIGANERWNAITNLGAPEALASPPASGCRCKEVRSPPDLLSLFPRALMWCERAVKHVLRDGDGSSEKKQERDERGKRRLSCGEGTQEKERKKKMFSCFAACSRSGDCRRWCWLRLKLQM